VCLHCVSKSAFCHVCVCVHVYSACVTVHGDEGVPAGPQGAV